MFDLTTIAHEPFRFVDAHGVEREVPSVDAMPLADAKALAATAGDGVAALDFMADYFERNAPGSIDGVSANDLAALARAWRAGVGGEELGES